MTDMGLQLDYIIDPKAMFDMSVAIGKILVVLSLVLLLQVVVMRLYRRSRNATKNRVNKCWRPVLSGLIYEAESELPKLRRKEVEFFLVEWNKYMETIQGDVTGRMIELIHRLELIPLVSKRLWSNRTRHFLLSMITLGNLRHKDAIDKVAQFLKHPSPIVSIIAARSLLKIDYNIGAILIINTIGQRTEWKTERVMELLKSGQGSDSLEYVILTAVTKFHKQRDVQSLARTIPFMYLITQENSRHIKNKILADPIDDKILAEMLKVMISPRDAEFARSLANHPRWHIRVQVMRTLGRIGSREDLEFLVAGLKDSEWWVRYRAAEAIVNFPLVDESKIGQIKLQLNDCFASDMLDHALAERAMQ